jgi:transposase
MRPEGSPGSLERRRRKALALRQKGIGPGDIARRLGVDRRSVHRWLAAVDEHGEEGLAAVPAPGRPPFLSEEEQAALVAMLLEGATAHGFPTALWTGPRVAELIQREFGVLYHRNHVTRLLRALGFSPQKPERRARERDEAAIRGWVRIRWPQVKKTPGG